MPKEKLTLSVDKEVVEKAKKLGLNISEVTELALKGFSFSAKEADREALYKSYEALFAAMRPALERFDTSVKVAELDIFDEKTDEHLGRSDILLMPDGTFFQDQGEISFANIRDMHPGQFLGPKEILSDFVESLANAVEESKETIKELEMARRIVSAIGSAMKNRSRSKARGGKAKHRSSKSRVT